MRFSHAHAPDAPPSGFWLMVAGFFLLLAAPVVAINLAVDPFDFRLVPHVPLPRGAVMPKNNTALWMAGEFRRIPQSVLDGTTIVFAGDSRTDSLVLWRTYLRVMEVRGDRVWNLCFGGASFDDTLRLLEVELPRLPRLHTLILGVSYENIGNPAPDRVESALRLHDMPWSYALNLGTLGWSLQLLRERDAALKSGASAADGPSLNPDRIPKVPRAMFDRAMQSPPEIEKATAIPEADLRVTIAHWLPAFTTADPVLVRRKVHDRLAPFVARLRERGVAVVFFIPPLRPEVREALGPAVKDAMSDFASELAKLGPVEDYSGGDRDGIPFRYRDHAHVEAGVAQAIFAHIYQRHFAKSPAPKP
ncbi:MAG: hypothetical protein ACREKL_00910 [Chthoniobacterales bacterium]